MATIGNRLLVTLFLLGFVSLAEQTSASAELSWGFAKAKNILFSKFAKVPKLSSLRITGVELQGSKAIIGLEARGRNTNLMGAEIDAIKWEAFVPGLKTPLHGT
ncbi:MAG: hypothetical protein JRH20_29615, partial [Deltaproteobacteria bacterium]|nr:hypothetical protein [Deltaproteobacteria bacterium]